ncbi:MAG: single-stranded-DNA-specific exonuclease RecJ [Bacteroidota bacterium]|nr:single-stranded-DNA-specific exonuclease RecJ [Bacteroidota bacterium]
MEITKKRWLAKEIPAEQTIIQKLQNELRVSKYFATLIAQKGITSFDEAKQFFNPSINDLHDPFLMKGMDKAVNRLADSIENNENILVYGDYDVDGTTSVALVYNYLSEFYNNLLFYIPDRFSEGYGLSKQGIDYAEKNNCKLLIVLDCGIKGNKAIDYANSKNIDVIVCDHHTPGDTLPKAFSILNPKQKDCNYPFKELSGCGVGFKFMQAFSQREKKEVSPFKYIDLVAVSIASDIVYMTDENRTLTYLGLKKLNENPIVPFKAMINILELKKELNVGDLVFIFGPRLNASGRLAHAKNTVDFLVCKNIPDATKIAQTIDKTNINRKEIDQSITQEALEVINENEEFQKRKTTVLYSDSWHKGVIGIVASRLIEKYYRPTILLAESNGMLTGSARSVAGFDLYSAIESCSEYIEQFGGHKFAAGLSIKKENFDKFSEKFEKVVSETIDPKVLIPSISYNFELPLEYATLQFIRSVERFGPFGPKNLRPKFISKDVVLAYPPQIVGENHLKIKIKTSKYTVDAIGFNLGHFLEDVKDKNNIVDICFTVEENQWNDKSSVQLNIKDIKINKRMNTL